MEHNCLKFIGTPIILISKCSWACWRSGFSLGQGCLASEPSNSGGSAIQFFSQVLQRWSLVTGLPSASAAVFLHISSPPRSLPFFFKPRQKNFYSSFSCFWCGWCFILLGVADSPGPIHRYFDAKWAVKEYAFSAPFGLIQQLGTHLEQLCYKGRKHVFCIFFAILCFVRIIEDHLYSTTKPLWVRYYY